MKIIFTRGKDFNTTIVNRKLKEEIKEYIKYDCTQKDNIKTITLHFKDEFDYLTKNKIILLGFA